MVRQTLQDIRRFGYGTVLLIGVLLSGCQGRTTLAQAPTYAVYFSPRGGCTEQIVKEIGQARERILVQAYSFTSPPIAQALAEAHQRGVQVDVLLDKSQRTERASAAGLLRQAGVDVKFDAAHAIAHNKIMVIDGRTVITGSFNFTQSAEERNAENLLIVHDPTLAAHYADHWATHRAHASPYEAGSRVVSDMGR